MADATELFHIAEGDARLAPAPAAECVGKVLKVVAETTGEGEEAVTNYKTSWEAETGGVTAAELENAKTEAVAAAEESAAAKFLPLTGGSVTNDLSVGGTLTVGGVDVMTAKRDKTDNTCAKTEYGDWVASGVPEGVTLVGQPVENDSFLAWWDTDKIPWVVVPYEGTETSVTFQEDPPSGKRSFTATRTAVCTSGKRYITEDVTAADSAMLGGKTKAEILGLKDGVPTDSDVSTLFTSANTSLMETAYGKSATSATSLASGTVAVVDGSGGGTVEVSFAAASGTALRYCELLIMGITADSAVTLSLPAGTYQYGAGATYTSAGNNHFVFAEYASGCWFVSKEVTTAATVTA